MSEDFGKEMLMLGGTIVGFLAALLTVLEKLLDMQHRYQARKARLAPAQAAPVPQEPVSSMGFFSNPLQGSSYLLLYETSVIVAAGVLLNYVGLTLSRHLESILFLDMTGTALAAIPRDIPFAPLMEDFVIPDVPKIAAGIRQAMASAWPRSSARTLPMRRTTWRTIGATTRMGWIDLDIRAPTTRRIRSHRVRCRDAHSCSSSPCSPVSRRCSAVSPW